MHLVVLTESEPTEESGVEDLGVPVGFDERLGLLGEVLLIVGVAAVDPGVVRGVSLKERRGGIEDQGGGLLGGLLTGDGDGHGELHHGGMTAIGSLRRWATHGSLRLLNDLLFIIEPPIPKRKGVHQIRTRRLGHSGIQPQPFLESLERPALLLQMRFLGFLESPGDEFLELTGSSGFLDDREAHPCALAPLVDLVAEGVGFEFELTEFAGGGGAGAALSVDQRDRGIDDR